MTAFLPGEPVGDYHSWASPQSAACPDCECCTAQLCWLAAASGEPCSWIGDCSAALVGCPCAARAEVARHLTKAVYADPFHPNAAPVDDEERQLLLNARNGALMGAAHAALRAGIPVGVHQLDPDFAIGLMLILPGVGKVTWHLPAGSRHLPDAPAPWEVIETAETYRRVQEWLTAQPATDPDAVRRAALIRVLLEAARRCPGNDHVNVLDLMGEAEGGAHARQHKVSGLAYNAARNAGARNTLPASRNAEIFWEVAFRLLAGEDVDTDWRHAADGGRQ